MITMLILIVERNPAITALSLLHEGAAAQQYSQFELEFWTGVLVDKS
jgi:hypothetical protein